MSEINKTIEQIGSAFEEFKKTNDQKLAELASKGHVDSLLEAKLQNVSTALSDLESIKSRLDAVEAAKQRINAAGESGDKAKAEHKTAFSRFLRKGDEEGLSAIEQKAYGITTNGGADGGFAVPEVIDSMIHDLLVDISAVRSVANVVTVSTSDYKKLVNTRGTASGWVGEADPRTETANSKLAEVKPFFGEIYANPAATQQMLDDVFFDAESWIAMDIATEFAKAEGAAFISGDGVNKPKGFLANAQTAEADGIRAFGTLQFTASGSATDIGGFDKLIDVTSSLKAGHRAGAVWMMNKAVYGDVRKLKTTDGHYLWQPSMQAGQPSTLLGYAVVEAEDMPSIADQAVPIAFGNFRAGYTIADRVGVRVLRDPYSNKPYVQFYTTKRVGGVVVDSEAIKLLKVSI